MGLTEIRDRDVKLIMVGGKGGVGKTTCASAIALQIARDGRRVLLLSSDPTPSLGDMFEILMGDQEIRLAKGHELFGLEVSSDMVLKRWKERFGPEIYEVISSFASVEYDFVDYIGTAPGIEEEFMLHFIVELVEDGKYDAVVWDTAPAGHTLRLLRLPHLFLSHMEAATKFYMNLYSCFEKVKDAVALKSARKSLLEIIENWEELSRKIIDFIRDGQRTRYVLVTIAEALGVRLTQRMLKELEENGLLVGNLIINQVVRDEDCPFHKIRKGMHEHYIGELRALCGGRNMVTLYLSPDEIKGLQKVSEISHALFSGEV
ncbi:MAG TPA: ArsA family ATPase [Syntrophorhabdales bacterium]|nr:ArsA family ATPase [Syntrophorhabdales bacterium]